MKLKRYGNYIIIFGILLMIAGGIFILQSMSLMGPPTSFMYKNSDWTGYGFIIIITGIIMVIFGIIITSSTGTNNR
ncbi:MAG: hypothetical protein ACTHJ7_11510 [Candidatus Nitrosocosmicus sp.]